jgi:hypothetical protein
MSAFGRNADTTSGFSTSTSVEASHLAGPDAMIETEAIAVVAD